MVFLECLEVLIVCTGNGEIAQKHGMGNLIEVAGANNDLTVLNNSSLFDDLLDSIGPVAPFECNGVTFEKGYNLADDIYPQWASFVKSFTVTSSEKNVLYKRKQEELRKDIDPTSGVWNMDTGASSHLNDSVTSLSDVFNTCIYPSVSVGDGHTIPVTNTRHSILPTPHIPLHLNNVLITPHIVKNLTYVRQFFRDNNCTVEFDAFGFSIKDFMTRRVLLRCDSTGDLYPVTQPSPIPHAFFTSQHTWHQQLGHPGSEVLSRLVSRNLISCNKEKPPVLCHACQLGKHVRLSFVSSNTSVTSLFDIVHSDVWTSPIPSLSGFKYYVLFLDHYSYFVWVYPLVNKLDVLSKYMLFRTYVNTQFKCEIKSFQCDHGGEFDNRALHTLFASKGIQFWFSCPKTS
ncbi:ribonuclease H-like domain-containing protein [Tanacetum coccineum]